MISRDEGTLEPVIRRARWEEARPILDLQKLAYLAEAELYGSWDIPPLTQTLDGIVADLQSMTVLVAELDGRVVGSVRGQCLEGGCRVGRLFVHPDWEGRGIGQRLLVSIEAAFPDAGSCSLYTGHRSNRNLYIYRKHGYVETRREAVGPGLVMVHLRKRLGPVA